VDDPALPAGEAGPAPGRWGAGGAARADAGPLALVATLSPWQLAARLSRSGLLSPAWPPGMINASSPVT